MINSYKNTIIMHFIRRTFNRIKFCNKNTKYENKSNYSTFTNICNKINSFVPIELDKITEYNLSDTHEKNVIYFTDESFHTYYPLSNFMNYLIIDDENLILRNACQFYIIKKLDTFDPKNDTLRKHLLTETNRVKLNLLSKQINNVDVNRWNNIKFNIMVNCLYLKFRQNTNAYMALMLTHDKYIAYAVPYSNTWGIGITEYQAKANMCWQGTNLLGIALMRTRFILKKDYYNNNICENL